MNIILHSKRKELISLFLVVSMCALLVCLSGCSPDFKDRSVPYAESKENFEGYAEKVKEIVRASSYGMEPTREESEESEENVYHSLSYDLTPDTTLHIWLSNFSGRESGTVTFRIKKNEPVASDNLDIDLVLEVVEVFSGYQYDIDKVTEVVNDRTGKYSVERSGGKLAPYQYVYNWFDADPTGNWHMSYRIQGHPPETMLDSYFEELQFVGLTKTGMN